ncbi:MAG: methylated-DNA--[protein]-cysteine S-methyltransferase [bacterium]|nr:methylated-DNA--[protein]-cysteine S-methyltransferase [bacterium]
MSTAVFYDLENISKFTAPKNYSEFKDSFKMMCDSELVDNVVLQRAYISTTHPAYIKYNKFLNSTGIDICAVDPNMNSKKANLVDFKMNVDCIAYSLSNNIDTVVIATGDADFGFLCEELKNYGKRVVVASYGITTNKSIIMLCDDWVDFSHEYTLCDINELMAARICPEEPVDYKAAVRGVLSAMLEDKLVKRYMLLERFDLDMLRSFTEKFYKAPRLEAMNYTDFISMLIPGINVAFRNRNGRILIVPTDEPVPEPPLSIYETISGMDFEFSTERFRAWHSWFEDNLDSVQELVYYMNFMTKNNLLSIDDDGAQIVPQRKCATALIEHTSMALSLLNIKPEDRELEKLRNRFYRNASKHRLQKLQQQDAAAEEIIEPTVYIQGTMTNFGRIVVYADDEAVFKVEFTDEFVKYNANELTSLAARELREYFKGERKEFTVPIKLNGSEFQKLVWEALIKIPYGETRTYKDIANAIGKPKSARAVGRACNTNALLFIVPCHRVIAASGDMAGYAAGIELKTALLKSESSPEDFKRFGKQYSFNIKHPESRCDYRTSEEIRRVLDKEMPDADEQSLEYENEDILSDSADTERISDKITEPVTAQEPITVQEPENTETDKTSENDNQESSSKAYTHTEPDKNVLNNSTAPEPEISEQTAENDETAVTADENFETDNEGNTAPESQESAELQINETENTESENTESSATNPIEEIVQEFDDDKEAEPEAETAAEPLNKSEPSSDTDTTESSEESPSAQPRKRRAMYRRSAKRTKDAKIKRKYSSKKRSLKQKEDNK